MGNWPLRDNSLFDKNLGITLLTRDFCFLFHVTVSSFYFLRTMG